MLDHRTAEEVEVRRVEKAGSHGLLPAIEARLVDWHRQQPFPTNLLNGLLDFGYHLSGEHQLRLGGVAAELFDGGED
mgnify:CR=1 FL=1